MASSSPRASWKGFLRASLVSVPVQAYPATATARGEIHFNQLHRDCHHHIRHQKICPVHGEITAGEIVSGYEYARGQSLVIEPEELDAIRGAGERAVTIDVFVKTGAIDARYHAGKTYFLLPDGPAGEKPYALIQQAMRQQRRDALARVMLSSRERLVLVRPLGRLLMMNTLLYDAQVNGPAGFEEQLAELPLGEEEIALAETLVRASTEKKLELSQYRDHYSERLRALVEAKVEGRAIVAAPQQPEHQVINLMEALRKSVEQVEGKQKPSSKRATSGSTRKRKRA